MSSYNIQNFVGGFAIAIDGTYSSVARLSWISWSFPEESDTLEFTIADPAAGEPTVYEIPFSDLTIGGQKFNDQDTIDAALKLLLQSPMVSLKELENVNAPAPNDGDVLTWDSATNYWIAKAPK